MREEGGNIVTDAQTYATYSHDLFRERADEVARDLRRIADRINQIYILDPGDPKEPRHAMCASQIVSDVIWGVANLKLDRLVVTAAAADVAEREVKA
jgi:hypothetical protein